MKLPRNIFLVGLMGSGKSTLGKRLAEVYNKTFIDSDREIEHRTGANISLIFDIEGEDGFRERESNMIAELTQRPNIVLATGGGAVIQKNNRIHLRAEGFVIYLHVEIDHLLDRMKHDKTRPLLQTDNPTSVLKKLSLEREPLYREVADWVLDTSGLSIHTVLNIINQEFEVS